MRFLIFLGLKIPIWDLNSFYKSGKGIGTRLGLYMGKNIVEAHGGKIWAKNNEDDEKWAIFGFNLPLLS